MGYQWKVGLGREKERTFGDGNVLKHQNDGGNWELRSKGRDQTRVDIRGSDVLKSPGDGAENLDGILAFDPTIAAIKPRSKDQDNHDEGIPQNGDEEKNAG